MVRKRGRVQTWVTMIWGICLKEKGEISPEGEEEEKKGRGEDPNGTSEA